MGISKHDVRQKQVRENLSCATCAAAGVGPFTETARETARKMDDGRGFGRFRRGQVLYQEGNPAHGVFCIKKGLVKLTRLGRQGVEHILGTAGPLSLIGMAPYLEGGVLDHSAVAATDLEVCHIADKAFREGLASDPALILVAAKTLARELSDLRKRWADRSEGTVIDRLWALIRDLPRAEGGRKTAVSIPLSRKELGSYLGAAPETVMRALKKLSDEGAIVIRGREIVVCAEDKKAGKAR